MSGTTEPRDSLAGSSGRCSRSMGVSTCAIPQPHRIDGLVALQELTQAGASQYEPSCHREPPSLLKYVMASSYPLGEPQIPE